MNFKIGAIATAVAALLLIFIASLFYTTVAPSRIAVVTRLGAIQTETLTEGPHLMSPLSRAHEVFIGRDVAKVEGAQAASKDLQSVHTDLTMNYNVDPTQVVKLYRMAPSLDYEALYVQPAMFEVFKAVSAKYTAEELVTKRSVVSNDIRDGLIAKLRDYGLIIQDINITNFKFSKSFDEAIEAKVTASQKAEQAERDLQRVKFETEQQVARAKGEAEAISIRAQAVKTNGGAEYLQLQAIEKWDGHLPTYMQSGAPLPFLSVK